MLVLFKYKQYSPLSNLLKDLNKLLISGRIILQPISKITTIKGHKRRSYYTLENDQQEKCHNKLLTYAIKK